MSKITFTLIQSTLDWENKKANLERFTEKINSIPKHPGIILLPEMFSTGFSMNPDVLAEPMTGETVSWMRKMAVSKKAILAGSVIIEEEGNYYNRMIWMLPDGTCGSYDKRHLFAYAGEDKQYTAGRKRLIASVNGWRINLQVCYDLRFPVWARQTPGDAPEYDVLVYVANWPEKRGHAWRTLLQARAIENQCYVVGVNRVGEDGNNIRYAGDSMVVDPVGEILYHKKDEEDIFTIELHKGVLEETRSRIPFLKDADHFRFDHEQ